jgi:hypothetical protein
MLPPFWITCGRTCPGDLPQLHDVGHRPSGRIISESHTVEKEKAHPEKGKIGGAHGLRLTISRVNFIKKMPAAPVRMLADEQSFGWQG